MRFLFVGAGGFLGLGEKFFLIPVEAVLEVKEDRVKIAQSRQKVVDSPPSTLRSSRGRNSSARR